MSLIKQPFGFGVSSPDMTLNFEASGASWSAVAAHTLSSIAIGSADALRTVVLNIGCMGGPQRTVSSVTLDGNSMTEAAYIYGTGGWPVAIYYLAWPTGTTADFVVTWSGATGLGCSYEVYKVTNLGSVNDTGGESSSNPNPFTDTVNVVAGGCTVATCLNNDGPTVGTCTWTNLSEDHDTAIATYYAYSSASSTHSSDSALAVTADWTGSPDTGGLVIASFAKG
jgi:hypothetical protein